MADMGDAGWIDNPPENDKMKSEFSVGAKGAVPADSDMAFTDKAGNKWSASVSENPDWRGKLGSVRFSLDGASGEDYNNFGHMVGVEKSISDHGLYTSGFIDFAPEYETLGKRSGVMIGGALCYEARNLPYATIVTPFACAGATYGHNRDESFAPLGEVGMNIRMFGRESPLHLGLSVKNYPTEEGDKYAVEVIQRFDF